MHCASSAQASQKDTGSKSQGWYVLLSCAEVHTQSSLVHFEVAGGALNNHAGPSEAVFGVFFPVVDVSQ